MNSKEWRERVDNDLGMSWPPEADKLIDDLEAAEKAAPDSLRDACEALMEYEKAMDGADGKGENEELYWKAVKLARAALGPRKEAIKIDRGSNEN